MLEPRRDDDAFHPSAAIPEASALKGFGARQAHDLPRLQRVSRRPKEVVEAACPSASAPPV
jgi:hypothetical protein